MTALVPSPVATVPAPGIELVAPRSLLDAAIEARFALAVGDRPVVAPGDAVAAGAVLAERLRDAQLVDLAAAPADARPGERWAGEVPAAADRRSAAGPGELLFESGGRWRLVRGEHTEPIETPVEGVVGDVRAGIGVVVRAAGLGLPAVAVLGSATRGRLSIVTNPDGELRPGSVDVGAAGQILVVGSRVDAETLTRARAMGVRGIVVAALAAKDRRDFLASEARQRAALHRLPPFGVLVLDGAVRRPIASPVMAVLDALAGRDVAIVSDPPRLVFGDDVVLPAPDPGWVRVRSGPLSGREGRWAGLAGIRRFDAGTHLEAGFVRFGEEAQVAVPLGDLERYV